MERRCVMGCGGLVTSTLSTLLALPTFYLLVHQLQERLALGVGKWPPFRPEDGPRQRRPPILDRRSPIRA